MRNMQKMWEDYAKEVQVLRERIAELREVLQRDKTMAPLERQELEARKRLLRRSAGYGTEHGGHCGLCRK